MTGTVAIVVGAMVATVTGMFGGIVGEIVGGTVGEIVGKIVGGTVGEIVGKIVGAAVTTVIGVTGACRVVVGAGAVGTVATMVGRVVELATVTATETTGFIVGAAAIGAFVVTDTVDFVDDETAGIGEEVERELDREEVDREEVDAVAFTDWIVDETAAGAAPAKGEKDGGTMAAGMLTAPPPPWAGREVVGVVALAAATVESTTFDGVTVDAIDAPQVPDI